MNQENMPLVTAVIPVYNHEKYVVESIRSILNQTYRNIELIILNDGSKDRSHEKVLTVVGECKERFVRFEYLNRENIGLSATLNQALGMAKGAYLTALASDDVALPEKIELLVNALEARGPAYAAAFGNALFIDDKGKKVRLDENGCVSEDGSRHHYDNFLEFYTRNRNFNYREEEFGSYETLIAGNYLPAMSNVVRTKLISEAGGWTVGNVIEDWEMWLKLSKNLKLIYIDQPVALYRLHETNTARSTVDGLVYASLLLVNREKDFCIANNLIPTWRKSHNSLMCALLLNRGFPLNKKVPPLKVSDKGSLLLFMLRHFASRFAVGSSSS